MKIDTRRGKVALIAETMKEAANLVSLFHTGLEPQTKTQKEGKYKRQYPKKCPKCGRTVKGNVGLGRHMFFSHGISRADREKAAKEKELPTIEA